MTDLVMYRGDDRSFTISTTGLPDLTGATIKFTAKRKVTDLDADAVIALVTPTEVEIVSASVFRVNIPAALTAAIEKETTLIWDTQIVIAGDVRTLPDAALSGSTLGTLLIRMDVTRTAP
jgi:carbon monoxide dehydrogenase subunit G